MPPRARLKSEATDVTTLLHHPRNPRRGDVGKIADSLSAHGQYKPIVVQKSTNHVLAGNHTLEAARQLGMTHIDAVFLDIDDDAALKILLVDNRTSDLGVYDQQGLTALLDELPDLTGTGYSPDDLDDLLAEAMLPAPLRVATHEAEGQRINGISLEWGFLQYGTRRVQISADEVAALDATYELYRNDNGTDGGFGFHLADDDWQANVAPAQAADVEDHPAGDPGADTDD